MKSVIIDLFYSKALVVVLKSLRDQREKKKKYMTVSFFVLEYVYEHR